MEFRFLKPACSAKKLFITEFPDSIFLLLTFLTGSKCDFFFFWGGGGGGGG